MERRSNTELNEVYDAACLELGEDNVPRQTVINCLQSIGSKPITYKNVEHNLEYRLGLNIYNTIRTHSSQHTI